MNLPVRLLLAGAALAAAAAPAAFGQEERPGDPPREGPAGGTGETPRPPAGERYVVQYPYGTSALADGELSVFLVEGVYLARGSFLLEARNVVLWADRDRLREEGGPLSQLAASAGAGEGPGPGRREKAVPPPPSWPGGRAASGVPTELRDFLGPVLHGFYAEGDVRFTLGTQTLRADRIYVDFLNNIQSTGRVVLTAGIAIASRQRSLPLVVRAERMRRVTEDTLLLEDVEYSTCDFAEPHYSFRCTTFEITEHEDYRTFTAWGNVLRAEGVPLFYLPVLAGRSDLSARPLRTASLTRSSRFGTTLELLWADDVNLRSGRWGEWRVRTDGRSRRGGGVGPEVEYDHGDYEGELRTYYQRDRATLDRFDDSPVPRDDRGRVRWEHRQRLAKDLRLDFSLWDFSDRNFQGEYLKDEALTERDPESYAYLRWRRGTDEASLSAKYRMDAFRTETTELPDASFRRIGAPAPRALVPEWLLDGLTWSLDARAGAYERRHDEATGIRTGEFLREDAAARVEGVRRAGPLSLAPFATAGVTVRQGTGDPGGGGDGTRGDLAAGLRATIEARRDFEEVRSGAFDLHGLRHVPSLELLWFDRMEVTEPPAGARAADRIDALDEVQVGAVRLRNRLQTLRGGTRVDWIDLEVRGLWFPGGLDPQASPLRFREEGLEEARYSDFPGEEKYRSAPPRGSRGPAEADLRVRLLENLYVIGEAEYDGERRAMITSAEGVRWFVVPKFSLYAGRRAIARDSDIYTFLADWFLSERWGLHASQQTDFRNREGLKTQLGIRRIWHDFILEIFFENDQQSNETKFGLSLIPSALWEPPTSAEKLGRLDFEAQRWYR